VSILGGELRAETLSIVDSHAVEEIRKLHADLLAMVADIRAQGVEVALV